MPIRIIAIIPTMFQVVRRDPLARLTEALVENRVGKLNISGACLWKRLILQVVHDGKEGSSLKLACSDNQQVELSLM